jgi:serine/threonine-protein kinase
VKRRTTLAVLCLFAFGVYGCGADNNSPTPSPTPAPTPTPSVVTFNSGGNYPEGIGIDRSDNVWIANRYSDIVAELSSKGAVLATFPVGKRPHGLKIDRGGTGYIWVQNTAGGGPGAPSSCSGDTTGTVTALNSSGALIGTFCTDGDGPQHAQFDASGNIWVTNQGSNTIAEISGTTGVAIATHPTGEAPHAVARDQSGNFWIGNYYSGTVTVLDSTGALIGIIPEDEVGLQPTGNDIDLSGNLWQSVQSADQIAIFAAAPSFAPIRSEGVGVGPRGVTIDAAGNVFVANQQSNNVIEFNSSGAQVAEFQVGACPENMAIDSKGDVWVTNACSSTVSVLKGVAVPSPNADDDSNG